MTIDPTTARLRVPVATPSPTIAPTAVSKVDAGIPTRFAMTLVMAGAVFLRGECLTLRTDRSRIHLEES